MSLTAALNTAVTGLTTIQAQTSVVSANIANANNANYTRKTVALTTPAIGGQPGAALVEAVLRAAAPELLQDYHSAAAKYGQLAVSADKARGLAEALGATETGGGQTTLESMMTRFETAVKNLEATPEDGALKTLVVQRGQELTAEIRRLAGLRSSLQNQAQTDISTGITTLNEASKTIARLNAQIVSQKAAGYPTGDLEDLRDTEVAKMAGLVGVRTMTSDTGVLSVFTETGTLLAGSTAQVFSYDATTGAISNGTGVDVTAGFRTGALRASLDYLDDSAAALASPNGNIGTLEKFFNQLDSLAQNIADVVNAAYGGAIFTYTAGDAGGTIAIDAALAADPNVLDAAAMGAVQQAMRNTTLTAGQVNPAGDPNGLSISNVNIFGLASGIMAYNARQTSDNEAGRDTAESLQAAIEQKFRNLTGVNVDDEMAQLQVLQTNYAALANIMNAITEMFDQLVAIGS